MRQGRQVALFWLSVAALLVVARFGLVRLGLAGARRGSTAEARRAAPSPEVIRLLQSRDSAPPRLDGDFPCVAGEVVGESAEPRLGRCGMPDGPVDRFEVDLRRGRFILRQTDLFLRDVFLVPLTRTYHSGRDRHRNAVHAFGRNASHPFDIAPVGKVHPYEYMFLVLEDDNALFFPRVSPGTGYADALFQHTETSTRFYRAVMGWNGSGWTVWLADGTAIDLPDSYRAKSTAQGAPTEIRDAASDRLVLRRDEQGNLLEIRTPHGRTIRLAYDGQDRIARAEDDAGQWAEYRYDPGGMLSDVALSSGRARHYAYDGALMTRIEDERRRVLLSNSYEDGWLVRQDFGAGEVYSYSYAGGGGGYAERAVVTLPDGRQTEIDTAGAVPGFVRRRGE